MDNASKKLLSRAECRKKLLDKAKFNCLLSAPVLLLSGLILVPLSIGMFSAYGSEALLLRVIAFLIGVAPVAVMLVYFLWLVWEYVVIAKDKFLIVEDCMTEKCIRSGRNGSRIPTFYFAKHGSCTVNSDLYERALCGEMFWTVIVFEGSKHPKMIFSVKEYELSED